MKTHFLIFVILGSLIFSCKSSPDKDPFNKNLNFQEQQAILKKVNISYSDFILVKNDSVLYNIQRKIKDAFISASQTKQVEPLEKLEKKLGNTYEKNPHKLILYWKAYLMYYKSLFHLGEKRKDLAASNIEQGMQVLQELENKNSEDYALWSLLKNFSIPIESSGMAMGMASNRTIELAKTSLELDSTNPRAYYILGVNNYYTPEKYGGKTKVERYLKEAISQPEQEISNQFLPSWGREESYGILLRFYLSEEETIKAKELFQSIKKEFPKSSIIARFKSKFN